MPAVKFIFVGAQAMCDHAADYNAGRLLAERATAIAERRVQIRAQMEEVSAAARRHAENSQHHQHVSTYA
jgi:hypothetical protein